MMSFSPVSQAEISPRPSEQNLLKKTFVITLISARAEISCTLSQTGLEISVWAEIQKTSCNRPFALRGHVTSFLL